MLQYSTLPTSTMQYCILQYRTYTQSLEEARIVAVQDSTVFQTQEYFEQAFETTLGKQMETKHSTVQPNLQYNINLDWLCSA